MKADGMCRGTALRFDVYKITFEGIVRHKDPWAYSSHMMEQPTSADVPLAFSSTFLPVLFL